MSNALPTSTRCVCGYSLFRYTGEETPCPYHGMDRPDLTPIKDEDEAV